jgi:hypothetical protein
MMLIALIGVDSVVLLPVETVAELVYFCVFFFHVK